MKRIYELTVRCEVVCDRGDPDELGHSALARLFVDITGASSDHGGYSIRTPRKHRSLREVPAHALARRRPGRTP